ncbi:MAG TPA: VWA domain-containing protein [Candidatus Sulfotelmatobacter sp.]|nr:VWA domain-containing protein [Candidatus Sulfotelmatobacter sp.]
MTKRPILLWTLLLLPPFLTPGMAQDSLGTIKVNVRLVEVYATVLDHKGKFVDGLQSDNFQILENGRPQRISIFESNTDALSCAILLDTTGSMREALPRVKNSVVKLMDTLDPQDSVAVFTFDDHLSVRQDFTTDKDAAKRAVLRTRAQGSTALFDAISEASEELAKRRGKKALIVFTDGDDNSSLLTAGGAIAQARKVGIPLYAIAEGEATHSSELGKVLNELSENTGGVAYRVKKADEIEEIFQTIASNLRHLYLLSYKPLGDSSDGRWRKIDIQISGVQDYHLRAKQGYFPQ